MPRHSLTAGGRVTCVVEAADAYGNVYAAHARLEPIYAIHNARK